MHRLPRMAILTGAAGLLPFLALGLLSVLPNPDHRPVLLLVGYGAVILSFLGGVHQGFAILAPGPLPDAPRPAGDWTAAEHRRVQGASLCALVAWLAVAAALYLTPVVALALLIAAFTALAVLEQRATAHGWMPRHYMWLRWVLSVIVVVTLAAVLVMRLLGSAS
jgi:hypothetical protein